MGRRAELVLLVVPGPERPFHEAARKGGAREPPVSGSGTRINVGDVDGKGSVLEPDHESRRPRQRDPLAPPA